MTTTKSKQTSSKPQRHWHRRPGLKIDDLLLKRHQHASQQFAPLARLIRQSDQRESLTQAVQALLPDDLRDTVEVVNFRAPSLVLRVGNASLATRLRYSLPNLTTKLLNLADFQGLTKINLRVVQTSTPTIPEKQPRHLPADAAKSLANLAEQLRDQPDYRDLSDTILRLSEHTLTNGANEAAPQTPDEANPPTARAETPQDAARSTRPSPENDTNS